MVTVLRYLRLLLFNSYCKNACANRQTICLHLPTRLGAHLAQRRHKSFLVKIIVENRLPVVTPIHQMINRAGIFNAQRTGHDSLLIFCPLRVKGRTDPFMLTKAEHQVYTERWYQAIGRNGWKNSDLVTSDATRDDIWIAAQKVYYDNPVLLEYCRKFLGK
jgi:hypothetical protein